MIGSRDSKNLRRAGPSHGGEEANAGRGVVVRLLVGPLGGRVGGEAAVVVASAKGTSGWVGHVALLAQVASTARASKGTVRCGNHARQE